MSEIAVIGAGYVGLTTAACFAQLGHHVVCADVLPERVDALSRGEVPILEAGLPELVRAGLEGGRLSFVLGAATAAKDCEFAYLCVPTPQAADGSADLSFIRAAAAEIGPVLPRESVVVSKSTVPVGSTRVVEEALGRDDVGVVSNPEFLREGSAVHDFLNPDRIVIGSEDQATAGRVASLFADVKAPVIVTDPASAETIKYASNAFLATKVSFANAVANVCEAVGADVRDVVLGMGYDHRIGFDFLKPGPGWGGSCFPKDTSALIRIAEDAGYDFGLLRGVRAVNEEQFERVTEKVVRLAGGSVDGRSVAAWGLTYKARTDDRRYSPALEVISRLRARGAHVRAYDPSLGQPPDPPAGVGTGGGSMAGVGTGGASVTTSTDLEGIEVVGDPYAACDGAAVLTVLTEWDEFRWVDFTKVASRLRAPCVVDARNLLDPAPLRRLGFVYEGIGL